MAYTREIVTLQVGHYSNFIGTHWWNLQNASFVYDEKSQTDINHDILFREGQTRSGEQTFLPRLIAIDLKGSLNTLKEEGVLYAEPSKTNPLLWSGKTSIYKTEPAQKNEFLKDLEKEEAQSSSRLSYNLDSEKDVCQASCSNTNIGDDAQDTRSKYYNLNLKVDLWTDYTRMHFHPRSIFLIDQFVHGNLTEPFEYFGLGQEVWADEKVSDTIEDKVRFFTEECDSLQGFHMLVDSHNGFSGLGVGIASLLQDEYGSKTILSFPCCPAEKSSDVSSKQPANRTHVKMFSAAYSLERLSSVSAVVVPVSLSSSIREINQHRQFPYLSFNTHLPYHSSAVIASALDTVTLMYRLRRAPLLVSDFAKSLVYRGMKVAGLSVCLPFPVSNGNLQSSLNFSNNENIVQSLTYGCRLTKTPSFLQNVSIRGLSDLTFGNNSSASTSHTAKNNYQSREELLHYFVKKLCPSKFSVIKEVHDPCHTVAPFPNIFSPRVNKNGRINADEVRPETVAVSQVPMMSGIHCNSEIGKMLNEIADYGKQANSKRFDAVFTRVLEVDDAKEMLESLHSLSANYTD